MSAGIDCGYYTLIGQSPVPEPDLLTWARWLEENRESLRVASTDLWPSIRISTVFLGLDHNFRRLVLGGEGGDPILFETMVFSRGGVSTGDMARCSTWFEAELQHREFVHSYRWRPWLRWPALVEWWRVQARLIRRSRCA